MQWHTKCLLCGLNLRLRKDRPASVIVYDKDIGTLPGSQFHKCCTNPTCGFTQYYGFYMIGGSVSDVTFNPDWASLPYFVSSRENVFSIHLLKQFNAEIVIGQLSFKQCADVYNFLDEYTNNSVASNS